MQKLSFVSRCFAFHGFSKREIASIEAEIHEYDGQLYDNTTDHDTIYVLTNYWSDVRMINLPNACCVTLCWWRTMLKLQKWIDPSANVFFQPPVWTRALSYPLQYAIEKDQDVLLPCSLRNVATQHGADVPLWPYICSFLQQPIDDLKDLLRILSLCMGADEDAVTYAALETAITTLMTPAEQTAFFQQILPRMVELVLQMPATFATERPQLLCPLPAASNAYKIATQGCQLTKDHVLTLLSACFFCIVPTQQANETEFPYFDMSTLFVAGLRAAAMELKAHKVRTILQYFMKVIPASSKRDEVLTFTRVAIQTPRGQPVNAIERTSGRALSPVKMEANRLIEELECHVQMDFANAFAGGGVFNTGCVQEEVRFLLSPELLVACLLFAKLEPHEAFVIHGSERCSRYTGYGFSYRFDGDFQDVTPYETLPESNYRRRQSVVIGFDAVNYNECAVFHQYRRSFIERDLLKAAVGFAYPAPICQHWPIATGNWGCGVFSGDPELKFLIQWLAATMANRPLTYVLFARDEALRHGLDHVIERMNQMPPSVQVECLLTFLWDLESLRQAKKRWRPSVFDLLMAFLDDKLADQASESSDSSSSKDSDEEAKTPAPQPDPKRMVLVQRTLQSFLQPSRSATAQSSE